MWHKKNEEIDWEVGTEAVRNIYLESNFSVGSKNDLPGGEESASEKAGEAGSIPSQGAKMPHAAER